MPDWPALVLLGAVSGLIAAAVMAAWQWATAGAFGQTKRGESSTERAADAIDRAISGHAVLRNRRADAGRAVHYATGLALGVIYVIGAAIKPDLAILFGAAYGLVVALVLDDALVPAFGFGPPAWKTSLSTHLYGLSAHIVFGMALEAAKRIGFLLF